MDNQANVNALIAKVQKEVPFTIIIPSYFPNGLSPSSINIGKPTHDNDSNTTWLRIIYYIKGTNKVIDIQEDSLNATTFPSGPSETFIVDNVKILSQEVNGQTLYSWNSNGVGFDVYMSGWGKDEGQKVVESMIK
jgi:hypothetical protein